MRLDDTVCRGSLIIHKGVSYVVLGPSEIYHVGMLTYRGLPISSTDDVKAGRVNCRLRIAENEEVDTFFPGVAYALPDYIR